MKEVIVFNDLIFSSGVHYRPFGRAPGVAIGRSLPEAERNQGGS
jgi:hypothetical protein